MTRAIVTLWGRVQGVGFRDTVLDVAQGFPVAGTVRNARDGARLEIDVEGAADAVEAFVAAVLASPPPAARVDRVDRAEAPPRGAQGFRRERSL